MASVLVVGELGRGVVELDPGLGVHVKDPEIGVVWDVLLLRVFSNEVGDGLELKEGVLITAEGEFELQLLVDLVIDHELPSCDSSKVLPGSDVLEAVVAIPGHQSSSLEVFAFNLPHAID